MKNFKTKIEANDNKQKEFLQLKFLLNQKGSMNTT